MKRVYLQSGFNEEQTKFLDIALKLYMYLKILADESVTLKHTLQNKEDAAAAKILDKKKTIKFNCLKAFKKKKLHFIDEEEEEINDLDFEDGLCFRFLGKFAKRLEVITEDPIKDKDQKELIFFEPNPKFSFLSEDTKSDFIEQVDRTSHESKIHGLISTCMYFEEEITIAEDIKKKYPRISSWFDSFREYEIGIFIICCLLNLFILIDYANDDDPETYFQVLITILASVECAISALCFGIWLWIRYPIEKKLNILRFCERKGCKIKDIPITTQINTIFQTVSNDNFVRVLILHLICCVLGLLLGSKGFFAVDILSIVNLFGTFKYLAKSISLHWHQLLFTFFMVLIFIYIYSVFSNLYFKENLEEMGGVCNGLIQCYFALLNTAFTNGSGLGGMLTAEEMKSGNYGRYFGYVIIDLMFFITVNCVALNLVFGIIVDTFGELRELNEKYGNLF